MLRDLGWKGADDKAKTASDSLVASVKKWLISTKLLDALDKLQKEQDAHLHAGLPTMLALPSDASTSAGAAAYSMVQVRLTTAQV